MKKYLLLAVAALGLGLTACNKNNDTGAGLTRVNVRMTDAPGAYENIWLSVKAIEVITSGGTTTMPVGSNPFDILKFRMGKDTLVASQDVPSGKIQEVRLILNPTGNTVRINGINHNLETPSGQTSGVKLKVHDVLTEGVGYTLLLDFDAAKSIVTTGNGKYMLKPVIRAVPVAATGAITGMISPAEANAKVYAIAGTDTVGTISDASGRFFFAGMPAGVYKVNVEPVSPWRMQSINDVLVVTGTVRDMGTITLSQQ